MSLLPDPPAQPSPEAALSFAGVAEQYDRARPTYPAEAAEWMTGRSMATVVELGAGTGKFTERLLDLGHDVLATDPLDEMLTRLRLRHPDLRTATAPAEAIPAATRSVDVVVAAQAFHWFDLDRALPEIARVLKPEGRVAVVWNERDERIPWVRKLGRIIGGNDHLADPTDLLIGSKLFGYVEDESFRHWQPLRRQDLRDLAMSRSSVAVLDQPAQERLLRQVDELFDEYDRGPDGLLLPYVTRCFRAVVRPRGHIEEPEHSADLTAAVQALREAEAARVRDEAAAEEAAATLIDFR